jgi:hypothetical protein
MGADAATTITDVDNTAQQSNNSRKRGRKRVVTRMTGMEGQQGGGCTSWVTLAHGEAPIDRPLLW